ncbi:hypothetical protein JJJ17_08365 [Paracoccus caeni]|uniref:Uncharacterized protein n=1 Tax=Paracoccus caeni TaxID=657651 RepID=A0A934SEK3_9RHOB|nr:hypothetical protein [Paracoccus caeni]MBK4215934.1 hypothetical protein [Paracoccus caeni]
MARGFLKGLVHGVALSGAALTVVSLAVPPSRQDRPTEEQVTAAEAPPVTEAQEQSQPDIEVGVGDAPVVVMSETAEQAVAAPETEMAASSPVVAPVSPQTAAVSEPLASAVDLPVGSEFGRGGDVLPVMPEPLTLPDAARRQAEPQAVWAPVTELAPTAVSAEGARPSAPEKDAEQRQKAEAEVASQIDRPTATATLRSDPPAADAPNAVRDVPGLGRVGGPDLLPNKSMVLLRAVESQPVATMIDAVAEAESGSVGAAGRSALPGTPRLPSPMPDLSLPPDLSELRGMDPAQNGD